MMDACVRVCVSVSSSLRRLLARLSFPFPPFLSRSFFFLVLYKGGVGWMIRHTCTAVRVALAEAAQEHEERIRLSSLFASPLLRVPFTFKTQTRIIIFRSLPRLVLYALFLTVFVGVFGASLCFFFFRFGFSLPTVSTAGAASFSCYLASPSSPFTLSFLFTDASTQRVLFIAKKRARENRDGWVWAVGEGKRDAGTKRTKEEKKTTKAEGIARALEHLGKPERIVSSAAATTRRHTNPRTNFFAFFPVCQTSSAIDDDDDQTTGRNEEKTGNVRIFCLL